MPYERFFTIRLQCYFSVLHCVVRSIELEAVLSDSSSAGETKCDIKLFCLFVIQMKENILHLYMMFKGDCIAEVYRLC